MFYHIRKYSKDPTVRRIKVYGGSSAAKTHSFCQVATIDGAFEGGYSTAVYRKEQAVVKTTIKPEFEDVMSRVMRYESLGSIWTKYDFEFRTDNNDKIVFKGLDKSDKAKGLKGFKKIYCDEVDQFKKEDLSELGRRLRGDENQQIWSAWNPVSDKHWLKEEIDLVTWEDLPLEVEGHEGWSKLDDSSFVKRSEDGRTILIRTTFLDNKWIVGGEVDGRKYGRVDEQVIAEFEEMKINNPEEYRVYGLGEWGNTINSRPFFPTLKRNCFDEFGLFKDYNLYLSFDFNVDECTCVAAQYVEDEAIYIQRAWAVFGGLTELLDEIKKDIPIADYMILITGDASGRSGSAYAGIDKHTGEKYNCYSIISNELGIPNKRSRFKVNLANKAHFMSYTLCSEVLAKIPVVFNKEFTQDLWTELFNAKLVDRFDKIELLKNKDEMNNLTDCFRYALDILFPNGIGSKITEKGSVTRAHHLLKEHNQEMLDWYSQLRRAH